MQAISRGVELVDASTGKFLDYCTVADKFVDTMNRASEASREQALGFDRINISIREINRVDQENASCAEETAAAAEEMNAQSTAMKRYVSELAAVINSKGSDELPVDENEREFQMNRFPLSKKRGILSPFPV